MLTAGEARGHQARTEPSADIRLMASFLYQLFVALTEQGFSESQALTVVGDTISTAIHGDGQVPIADLLEGS